MQRLLLLQYMRTVTAKLIHQPKIRFFPSLEIVFLLREGRRSRRLCMGRTLEPGMSVRQMLGSVDDDEVAAMVTTIIKLYDALVVC